MESIQQIRARIQSISSTRQITSSMRLVATSKIERLRQRLEENRAFQQATGELILRSAQQPEAARHPYVAGRAGGRRLVIVVGGDRGLCGGYSTNVCRTALDSMAEDTAILTVGLKTHEYFARRRPGDVVYAATGMSEHPFFEDAVDLAERAVTLYNGGTVGEVRVIYTRFLNMLSAEAVDRRLLPLDIPPAEGTQPQIAHEPGCHALLDQAVPFHIAGELFAAIMESSLCEQSSRIVSMDTAAKNSDNMIEALTLRYNQARQSAITMELSEIMSGASAVQGDG